MKIQCTNWHSFRRKMEVEVDKKETTHYFKMASDKGDEDSMYDYACMLMDGNAIVLFKTAADKGNVSAMLTYASLLNDREGTINNHIILINKKKLSKNEISTVFHLILKLSFF